MTIQPEGFVAYVEAPGLTSMSDAYYGRAAWAENEYANGSGEGALAIHRDTNTGYVYLSARTPDGKWHLMAGPVA